MDGNRRDNNLIASDYCAVILAAGYSSRMKAFKPLLPVGEKTAIDRSIAAAKGAGITDIFVVTGYNRQHLTETLEKNAAGISGKQRTNVVETYNEDFDKGMFSSIKKGMAEVVKTVPDAKGVFLLPVDCPLISCDVITCLMQNADDDNFSVPVFEGKKGHPLYIPAKYFGEICAYDGSGGLKAVTDKYRDKMVRVPVDEEGCVMDMDTPEGYDEINAFLAAGCRRVPLDELAKGRNIFLIRHGQTKQHDEKMLIGRYDVPLAEDAEEDIREMAMKIAEELAEQDISAQGIKIYTSPLQRAERTAEIIKETWDKIYGSKIYSGESKGNSKAEICIVEEFQEISLGSWDGLAVREVKEKYPEEYAERGKDIFAFKIGNKAENFYDVQYRAVKALRKIFELDDSDIIIIVTHSAVIRALENNLKNLKVEDDWAQISKCAYKKMEL